MSVLASAPLLPDQSKVSDETQILSMPYARAKLMDLFVPKLPNSSTQTLHVYLPSVASDQADFQLGDRQKSRMVSIV
jgi:hypothetical protein